MHDTATPLCQKKKSESHYATVLALALLIKVLWITVVCSYQTGKILNRFRLKCVFIILWEWSYLDFFQLKPSVPGQQKTPMISLRTLLIASNHVCVTENGKTKFINKMRALKNIKIKLIQLNIKVQSLICLISC